MHFTRSYDYSRKSYKHMTYLLHFCNNARQKRKVYITYKL